MDMGLKEVFLDRWKKYFGGAELPITCWYTDDERAADRAEPPKGHRCFGARYILRYDRSRDEREIQMMESPPPMTGR